MPPQAQRANSVGLGVYVDDPANATLAHLRDVNAEVRLLIAQSRELGSLRLPRLGERQARTQQTAIENIAKRETQARTQQLQLFDQAHVRFTEAQKRRTTDVADHTIRQGRRMTDAYAQATRSMAQQMKDMSDEAFRTFAAAKPATDPHVLSELERRYGASGQTFLQQVQAKKPYPGQRPIEVDPNAQAKIQREFDLLARMTPEQVAAREAKRTAHLKSIPKDPAEQGPTARERERRAVPSQGRLPLIGVSRPISLAMGEPTPEELAIAEAAAAARARRAEAYAARARNRIAMAPKSTFDLPPGLQRDKEVYQQWNQRRQKEGLPYAFDPRLETQGQRERREAEEEERAYLKASERRRRTMQKRRADARVELEENRRRREQLAQDEKYRVTVGTRLGAAQTSEIVAGVDTLQQRRGESRDTLEQFRRDATAQELRRRLAQRRTEAQAQRQRAEAERIRREEEEARREAALPPPSARRARSDPEREARVAASREALRVGQLEAQFGPSRKELDSARDGLIRLQNEMNRVSFKGATPQIRAEARQISGEIRRVVSDATTLRREIQTPASFSRTAQQFEADAARIRRSAQETQERVRVLRQTIASSGPPSGPEGPNLRERNGPFGTFDMLGRITRNILLYRGVSLLTQGVTQYSAAALQAAVASDDLGRALDYAGDRADRSTSDYEGLVDELKELGQGRRQAQSAILEAARFTEKSPDQTEPLVEAVTNIAAARGLGLTNVDQLIEQFRRRESKFYKRSLGSTVEELYIREARKQVETQPELDPRLFIGPKSDFQEFNRSKQQRVTDMVQSFSEAQKEQIAINAIIEAGGRAVGEAARRQDTLAGSLDRLKAGWEDGTIAVGEFIFSLRPVRDIVDSLTQGLEGLGVAVGRIRGTGPGGIITDADVRRTAAARTSSPLFRAKETIEEYGGAALTGGVAAVGLGLLGRRQARLGAAQAAFDRARNEAIGLGFDNAAAAVRANAAANQARAGITRTVTTGMGRVTTGYTNWLAQMFGFGEQAIRTQGALAGQTVRRREARSGGLLEGQRVGGAYTPVSFLTPGQQAVRSAAPVLGGLTGAVVGAEVASLVAQRIEAGPITATALTILGGVAGTAAGTAIGSAAGGLAAGVGAKALGIYGVIAAIAAGGAYALTDPSAQLKKLQQAQAEAELAPAQLERTRRAESEDRLRFYLPGRGRPEGFTGAEAAGLARTGQANLGDFQKVISQAPSERPEIPYERSEQRATDEFWQGVEERQREKQQDILNRQGAALARLREAALTSTQIIGEVGGALAQDNPYVAIFADGVTAAERMRRQFGHLTDDVLAQQTALENHRIAIRLLGQEYDSLARIQELTGRADRERAERDLSPDLTRQETAIESLAQVMTRAATTIPELQRRRALFLGNGGEGGFLFDQERFARAQIEDVEKVRDLGAGLDEQGRRAVDRVVDEGVMGVLNTLPQKLVREIPFFRARFVSALDSQIDEMREQIREAGNRVRLVQLERQRITQEQAQVGELRRRQEAGIYDTAIRQGRGTMFEGRFVGQLNPQEQAQINRVGQLEDRALIRITEGWNQRELGPLFEVRNAALRREAEREVSQQAEAREAILAGVAAQQVTANAVEEIRNAIVSGDISMLVRVENDTQARVDAETLKDLSSGLTPRGGLPVRTSQPPKGSMGKYSK